MIIVINIAHIFQIISDKTPIRDINIFTEHIMIDVIKMVLLYGKNIDNNDPKIAENIFAKLKIIKTIDGPPKIINKTFRIKLLELNQSNKGVNTLVRTKSIIVLFKYKIKNKTIGYKMVKAIFL